jgi:DnaJ-class molecular chaperone
MNYYDVLGVKQNASSETIDASHKTLAKLHHPDVNNSVDAHDKMAMLNQAKDVLSDSSKREEYDKALMMSQQPRLNREHRHNGAASTERPRKMAEMARREEQAEQLRKKAEARLKYEEAECVRKTALAKKVNAEKARRRNQLETAIDKQIAIDMLATTVKKHEARLLANAKAKPEAKVDLNHAVKVLISLIRSDEVHLRKMAEEAERRKRIQELLSLVKGNADETV